MSNFDLPKRTSTGIHWRGHTIDCAYSDKKSVTFIIRTNREEVDVRITNGGTVSICADKFATEKPCQP